MNLIIAEFVIITIHSNTGDENPNGHLCTFLFDNGHERWQEYISVLNSWPWANYAHLAVPLLETMLLCNSTNDIMARWSGLLQIIQNRTPMGAREIVMSVIMMLLK